MLVIYTDILIDVLMATRTDIDALWEEEPGNTYLKVRRINPWGTDPTYSLKCNNILYLIDAK